MITKNGGHLSLGPIPKWWAKEPLGCWWMDIPETLNLSHYCSVSRVRHPATFVTSIFWQHQNLSTISFNPEIYIIVVRTCSFYLNVNIALSSKGIKWRWQISRGGRFCCQQQLSSSMSWAIENYRDINPKYGYFMCALFYRMIMTFLELTNINALFTPQMVIPRLSVFLGGGTAPMSPPFCLTCSHCTRTATDCTRFLNRQ